ncbi:hypothetical protein TKK_0012449 [Trichogramma kaykai]
MLAESSPEIRVSPKRGTGVLGPRRSDENNKVAEEFVNYVLVDNRRHYQCKPQPQVPSSAERDPACQPQKLRPNDPSNISDVHRHPEETQRRASVTADSWQKRK